MNTTITSTYARFFYPGVFMSEESTLAVPDRNPKREARYAPDGAFAFEYYDVIYTTAQVDGEDVTLNSAARNTSGRYYINAQTYGEAEVEALPGDNRILLSNIRSNDYHKVVKCRTGNWQPLEENDVVIYV